MTTMLSLMAVFWLWLMLPGWWQVRTVCRSNRSARSRLLDAGVVGQRDGRGDHGEDPVLGVHAALGQRQKRRCFWGWTREEAQGLRSLRRAAARKRHLNAKALLVGIRLAACLLGSYRRSDVCSILNGLHPAIASELGLVDHHSRPITVKYKVVQATCRWLEWRLRLGWYADDVRCDLTWITNAMVAASVPRRVRRAATAVALREQLLEGVGAASAAGESGGGCTWRCRSAPTPDSHGGLRLR